MRLLPLAVIAKMWTTATERVAPRNAARLHRRCAHDLGRSKLADVEGLDGFIDAASQIIESVEGGVAPALHRHVRGARARGSVGGGESHQAVVLRELRGSVRSLALVSQGLDSATAHAIKRPDDVNRLRVRDRSGHHRRRSGDMAARRGSHRRTARPLRA